MGKRDVQAAVSDASRSNSTWNSAELPTDRGSVSGLSPNENETGDLGTRDNPSLEVSLLEL